MPLHEEPDYKPCANCNDEYSETIEWGGKPLCEKCYNAWKCGCDLCDECGEIHDNDLVEEKN